MDASLSYVTKACNAHYLKKDVKCIDDLSGLFE